MGRPKDCLGTQVDKQWHTGSFEVSRKQFPKKAAGPSSPVPALSAKEKVSFRPFATSAVRFPVRSRSRPVTITASHR